MVNNKIREMEAQKNEKVSAIRKSLVGLLQNERANALIDRILYRICGRDVKKEKAYGFGGQFFCRVELGDYARVIKQEPSLAKQKVEECYEERRYHRDFKYGDWEKEIIGSHKSIYYVNKEKCGILFCTIEDSYAILGLENGCDSGFKGAYFDEDFANKRALQRGNFDKQLEEISESGIVISDEPIKKVVAEKIKELISGNINKQLKETYDIFFDGPFYFPKDLRTSFSWESLEDFESKSKNYVKNLMTFIDFIDKKAEPNLLSRTSSCWGNYPDSIRVDWMTEQDCINLYKDSFDKEYFERRIEDKLQSEGKRIKKEKMSDILAIPTCLVTLALFPILIPGILSYSYLKKRFKKPSIRKEQDLNRIYFR
ncbi:MAG: hypothetical protein ABIG37_00820 [Nanoarchaeota archaeon]